MAYVEKREHERILITMPTRMWLDEEYKGKKVLFEGFAKTRDLAIGGAFVESTYLLPVGYPVNLEMNLEGGEILAARGQVVHQLGSGDGRASGMGVVFTDVDAENRERLLRFFISDRIRDFYGNRFVVEFPHLENVLSLQDVALVINLWEDREGRLTALGRSQGGKSGAPRQGAAASSAGSSSSSGRKPKR